MLRAFVLLAVVGGLPTSANSQVREHLRLAWDSAVPLAQQGATDKTAADQDDPGKMMMYLGNTMMAPAAPRKRPKQEGGLELEVEFDRRQYLLGEPIWVRCSLANYGKEPVTLSYGRDEAKNIILFDIEKRVKRRTKKRDSAGPQPLIIKPGWRLVEWYNLVDEYEITEPGEYTARVRYESDGKSFNPVSLQTRTDLWKGKLEQSLGTFTIVRPTRQEDQAALEWLITNSMFAKDRLLPAL